MRKKRVVVTGLGVISANGIGIKSFWDFIKNGKSGIGKITLFDAKDYPVKVAAEVKSFEAKNYIDEKTIAQTAKFAQFALVAAREALEDAKLSNYNPERTGVAIGTSMGGLDYILGQHNIFLKDGPLSIDTFSTSKFAPSAAARVIALKFRAQGSYTTSASACVASSAAIGYALDAIRENKADIMIAGGTETPISPEIISGFYVGRVLTTQNEEPIKVPRPFDLKRAGTVLGEGAAILILEELDFALKRGAYIYAEIAGYGESNDGYHVVIPEPEGTQAIRAIQIALKDAQLQPNQINYINAHGTASVRNDQVETLIIKKVFGKDAYKIPVSATKAMTGHLLGSAGAIEALICVLAIKHNLIPPTINYENPDPECDLDYVPSVSREQEIKAALSNSFGFGGFNAALILKKYV